MISSSSQLSGHDRPVKVVASNARITTLAGIHLEHSDIVYPGDICLFEMIAYGDSYNEIENLFGRSEKLYIGDCFVAPLGNRESGHYVSGYTPADGIYLKDSVEMYVLSNGGIVGLLNCSPEYLGPTAKVKCVGRLADDDGPINMISRGKTLFSPSIQSPIVLVAGSGTNSGKTTFMSSLIHELSSMLSDVAAAKITGTGCLEDMVKYRDAGASTVLDFPDSGLPSTYMDWSIVAPRIWNLLSRITLNTDLTVLEAGGDIIWANGPQILQTLSFAQALRRIIFIPSEPMAALGAQCLFDKWSVSTEITWVIPPFSNPESFVHRMRYLNIGGSFCDSRSNKDIHALARSLTRGDR